MRQKPKARRNLGRLNNPALSAAGKRIVTLMTDNPFIKEPYPTGVTTLTQAKDTLEKFDNGCLEARSGAKQSLALLKSLRAQLIAELHELADYVNLVAKGNIQILSTTGFDYTKESTSFQPKQQTTHPSVEMSHGEKRGSIIAKAKKVPRAASCEIHTAIGDPTVEANWKHAAVFAQFKRMEVDDLTPGQQYAFRMRWIMPEGPGPWSPPLFFMPT
jgi:hypothetical protein